MTLVVLACYGALYSLTGIATGTASLWLPTIEPFTIERDSTGLRADANFEQSVVPDDSRILAVDGIVVDTTRLDETLAEIVVALEDRITIPVTFVPSDTADTAPRTVTVSAQVSPPLASALVLLGAVLGLAIPGSLVAVSRASRGQEWARPMLLLALIGILWSLPTGWLGEEFRSPLRDMVPRVPWSLWVFPFVICGVGIALAVIVRRWRPGKVRLVPPARVLWGVWLGITALGLLNLAAGPQAAGIAVGLCLVVGYVGFPVAWLPLVIFASARDGMRRPDLPEPVRILLLSIALGAATLLLLLGFVVLFGIELLAIRPAFPDLSIETVSYGIVPALFIPVVVAIYLPFIGIMVSFSQRLLWSARRILRRGALIAFVAAAAVQTIGFAEALGALPLLEDWRIQVAWVALLVVLARPLNRFISRLTGEEKLAEQLAELSSSLRAPAGVLTPETLGNGLHTAFETDRTAIIIHERKPWSVGWEGGIPIEDPADALEMVPDGVRFLTVLTDDGPLLALPAGPPTAPSALALLGPRTSGQFFTTKEAEGLSHALGPVLSVL